MTSDLATNGIVSPKKDDNVNDFCSFAMLLQLLCMVITGLITICEVQSYVILDMSA